MDEDPAWEGDEGGGCGPCQRAGGLLLLALGAGLIYMGADLVTGGALTRLVAGGLGAGLGAAAAARPGAADNEGAEVSDGDGAA